MKNTNNNKKFFSKIDIVKAYYNIPVAKRDIAKTAVITLFGLYEFLKMPFGLRNAAQTFQQIGKLNDAMEFHRLFLFLTNQIVLFHCLIAFEPSQFQESFVLYQYVFPLTLRFLFAVD